MDFNKKKHFKEEFISSAIWKILKIKVALEDAKNLWRDMYSNKHVRKRVLIQININIHAHRHWNRHALKTTRLFKLEIN